MKWNLKDLRELIHDCHADSMLEAYCDNLIAQLREMHEDCLWGGIQWKITKEILGE